MFGSIYQSPRVNHHQILNSRDSEDPVSDYEEQVYAQEQNYNQQSQRSFCTNQKASDGHSSACSRCDALSALKFRKKRGKKRRSLSYGNISF